MKVKIFSNSTSINELEIQINQFIEENNVEVLSINTSISPMHDLYYGGGVRNQWEQYTISLVYKSINRVEHE